MKYKKWDALYSKRIQPTESLGMTYCTVWHVVFLSHSMCLRDRFTVFFTQTLLKYILSFIIIHNTILPSFLRLLAFYFSFALGLSYCTVLISKETCLLVKIRLLRFESPKDWECHYSLPSLDYVFLISFKHCALFYFVLPTSSRSRSFTFCPGLSLASVISFTGVSLSYPPQCILSLCFLPFVPVCLCPLSQAF